jgi:hypothetical protein
MGCNQGRLEMSARKTMLTARVAKESVEFRGHPMVRSGHLTTIEITTDDHLTVNGDCIIGVGASKGCAQLDGRVKEGLRRRGSKVTIRILVGNYSYTVNARGDPALALSHPHDMVVRKSDFISDRTLAVQADSAAKDIPREIVHLLRNPATVGRFEIEVSWG